MMSSSQLKDLAKKLNAPDSIVFREYIQLIFLENLYAVTGSEKIIFKGGTAVHLKYQATRFSEDLDFTVLHKLVEFEEIISKVFRNISQSYEISFKERKTITGKRYLLTANPVVIKNPTFINLDFSFRENVTIIEKSPLVTIYPHTVSSPVYYMGKNEIVAEKIRAILTRHKGRDIYDLSFLLQNQGIINENILKSKFAYYSDKDLKLSNLKGRISDFPVKDFVEDLRPFVSLAERDQLADRYPIIQEYLISRVKALQWSHFFQSLPVLKIALAT